jgi:hypothetical protein
MSAPEPFTGWRGCVHGLSADLVRLHRDEAHDAVYIDLDRDGKVSIRVSLKGDGAALERDRKGLRRLAAVAVQAAQEIEQLQRGEADR